MTRVVHDDAFERRQPLDEVASRGLDVEVQVQLVATHSTPERRARPISSQQIRDVLRARSRRKAYLAASLFADPAWDMLLELYASSMEQRRVSISSIGAASGVPATTALRWLNTLILQGLVRRRDDPLDARRAFVELSEKGLASLDAYFQDLSVQPRVL